MPRLPGLAAGLRAETELLLCAARTVLTPERAERLRVLARQPVDWDELIDAAEAHGTMPLLWQNLSAVGLEVFSEVTADRLRSRFYQNLAHNLFLSAELLRLMRLFEARNIGAMPFKGPTLAQRAYGSLALRQFGDLDILIDRADFPAAQGLLLERGYRLPPDYRAAETAYLHAVRQLPFLHEADSRFVELHAALMPRDFFFPLDLEHLNRRREAVLVAGKPVRCPAAEDLLLILCAHGGKHRWSSLGWICDVAELIRAAPDMDWDEVFSQARRLHSERLLDLGLLLAGELLDATLPQPAAQRLRGQPVLRSLAGSVCRVLFASSGSRLDGVNAALFHLRARERWRDGIRYSLSVAIRPTLADWTALPRPVPPGMVHYLLRPIRLAGKYGKKLLRVRR